MTAQEWNRIQEASDRALEFLASLAIEEDGASDRSRTFNALMDELDDPAKFHSMLYSLMWIAHNMLTSASGDTEPGMWTFELDSPFGPIPVDQAPPATRWVARWLVACMNGDSRAAADLWFGVNASEEEARESTALLVGPLVAFLTHAVREFVRAGKPLVMQEER